MKVILLAAGRGRRFGKRTAGLPKCLIPLSKNENLLSRYLAAFRKLGLSEVVVVVGHEKERVIRACVEVGRGLSIKFLFNPSYKEGSIVSLARASGELDTDCLIMDADVYFESAQLKTLHGAKKSSFLIDPRSKSSGEEMMVMAKKNRILRVSKKIDPGLTPLGEAVGFFKVSKKDAPFLAKTLKKMVRSGKTGVEYEEAYNELMKKRSVGFKTIRGFWTEMDFEEDLKKIKHRLHRLKKDHTD